MTVFPVWIEGEKKHFLMLHLTRARSCVTLFNEYLRIWAARGFKPTLTVYYVVKKEEDFLDCGFSRWTSQISDPKSQAIQLRRIVVYRSLFLLGVGPSSLQQLSVFEDQRHTLIWAAFFFFSFFLSGCQRISMEDGGPNFLNSVMKSVQLWDEGVTRRWNGKLKRSENTWEEALNAWERKKKGGAAWLLSRCASGSFCWRPNLLQTLLGIGGHSALTSS